MTIVEFLRARYAERLEVAERAGWDKPTWVYDPERMEVRTADGAWSIAATKQGRRGPWPLADVDGRHIALNDPAAVKADIEAKRRIVDLHEGSHECSGYDHNGDIDNYQFCLDSEECSTLRLLATIDDAHPDYDPAWRLAD